VRRIFGPRREQVTQKWRKLHNEELTDMYSSHNIIREIKSRMRLAVHVACTSERQGAQRVLVGRPEGNRPLKRPRRRWVDNTKTDLQKLGMEDMGWTDLTQERDR